jgi:hypothetical protein
MSDHDRGAYTPQPDAPLSFDARTPRDQRPLPILLIASCVILAAMVVAGFLLYRSGVRGQNEPPRPVGEPIANIKSPPPADASGNATDEKAAATSGAPNFAPPPEQPINRAAAPNGLTVATAPPPLVKLGGAPPPPPAGAQPQTAPAQSAPVQSASVQSAPVQPARAPVPAPAAHKDQPAKPAPVMRAAEQFGPDGKAPTAIKGPVPKPEAPVKTAKAEPAPKAVQAHSAPAPVKAVAETPAPAKPAAIKAAAAKPAAAGGVVVQVGAYVSADLAAQGYEKVAGLMGGKMGGHGRRVEPVAVGGATRYRSQVTGFATRADETAFCVALKAKGHDCIVKAAE